MHLKNKEKIKLICEITVSLYAVLVLLSKIGMLGNILPEWLLDNPYGKIVIFLLLYAIFRMWVDDFLKKKWKEKDYRPLMFIIMIAIIYLTM
jgi:UDP-N-acetylmuramyl pentapeptide phosphotransferase/UDP-N-acetylglucosamine-1-phosphate transferase